MRLLVALAPRLNDDELARLEQAILAGPPREMYRDDIEEERWTGIQDRDIWLRLAKISQAGAQLNAAARERLVGLSAKSPNWQLAENERDEFPTWTGDGSELRIMSQRRASAMNSLNGSGRIPSPMSGDPMTGASAAETTSVPRHPRSLRWQRKEYGQQVVGVKLYSGGRRTSSPNAHGAKSLQYWPPRRGQRCKFFRME